VFLLAGSPTASNLALHYAIAVFAIAGVVALIGFMASATRLEYVGMVISGLLGCAFVGAIIPGLPIAFYVSLARQNLVYGIPAIMVVFGVIWFAFTAQGVVPLKVHTAATAITGGLLLVAYTTPPWLTVEFNTPGAPNIYEIGATPVGVQVGGWSWQVAVGGVLLMGASVLSILASPKSSVRLLSLLGVVGGLTLAAIGVVSTFTDPLLYRYVNGTYISPDIGPVMAGLVIILGGGTILIARLADRVHAARLK